jgi:hypothetical protein
MGPVPQVGVTRRHPSAGERPTVPARTPRTGIIRVAGIAAVLLWPAVPGLPAQEPERTATEPDRFLEECGDHAAGDEQHGEEASRLSDSCIPLAEIPSRPRPLLELGEPFLGTGTLHKGIRLPGGAVWQPSFLAFGTIRSAAQGGTFDSGDVNLAEAVGRLDLFGNLYLTQTERVLVGLRPLDRDGRFTGYTFSDVGVTEDGEEEDRFQSELNGVVRTLFFEGDLGELFPNLDNDDSSWLDIYFSVGRQPLDFQDGMLLNEDAIDMVGLTRANLKLGSVVNTRITGVYAWGEINRHGGSLNVKDDSASLFGLFTELDLRATTLQFDAAYVTSGTGMGDGIYAGIGDIRRFGRANNVFRVLASFPIGDETPYNTRGFLIHDQFSWTSLRSHNLWYIGAYAGIDRFRSASRGPSAGGPLGQTGVLFAAPGIGRIGSPLGSGADDSAGGAIGRQMFFDHTRKQLVLELGGRFDTSSAEVSGVNLAGAAARFQAAMGRRFVFLVDGVGAWNIDESESLLVGRIELVIQM